jgi:hypothetical protein
MLGTRVRVVGVLFSKRERERLMLVERRICMSKDDSIGDGKKGIPSLN